MDRRGGRHQFDGPEPSPAPPTLYEWAGGEASFQRLFDVFYGHVLADDLLEPGFRHMDPGHPRHMAAWLGDVFGGPPRGTRRSAGATVT